MFESVPSGCDAGIGVHRRLVFRWRTVLLMGEVAVHDGLSHAFHLTAVPNMAGLKSLDADPSQPTTKRRGYFLEEKNRTLVLGFYPSFKMVQKQIRELEKFFIAILAEKGAENRLLDRAGERLQLVPADRPTEATFGEALKIARDREVVATLESGGHLSMQEIAGRIFRSFANALGIDYYLSEERSQDDHKSLNAVTFTYDRLAAFRFAARDEQPIHLTRLNFGAGGRFVPTFEGPADQANLQRHVFRWMRDALRDMRPDIDTGRTPVARTHGDGAQGTRTTTTGAVLKLV